jgi:hypothetical protein
MILLFMLTTGCSPKREIIHITTSTPGQNSLTPTIASNSLTEVSNPIEVMVPYSKTSIWNTPIGPSPKYDVHSDEMIANLAHANEGRIITAGEGYNYPVYFADENTPRWDIPCLINECTIASSDKDVIRTHTVRNVPVPVGAKPGDDTDGRMIVIDAVTHTEYDLVHARRTAAGWEAGTVSVYNILWNATPVMHSSRGSGIPGYAGLLRPWEIRQGRIEHALAFGYTEPAIEKCVYPASKTDGDSKIPFAIPEGARLQLDPSLTEADFDQMGLNRSGKIIARALQEYGMIMVDHSGSFKIYVEDLINNPFAKEDWTDPELNLTKESIYKIPYTSFRVLELPPGYWEPSENTDFHGQCIAFPTTP